MDACTNAADNGVLNGHLPQESPVETRPLQLFKSVVVPINEHKKSLRGETLFVSDCKIEGDKKCAIGVRLPTFCFGFVIGLIVAITLITFITYVLHDFGNITFHFAANSKINDSKNSSNISILDYWEQDLLLQNWSYTSAVPTETARNSVKTSNLLNLSTLSTNSDRSEIITSESVTTSTIKEVDNTFHLNLTSFEEKEKISKEHKYNLSKYFDTQTTSMSSKPQLVNFSLFTTLNSVTENTQTMASTDVNLLNSDRVQMTSTGETATEEMHTMTTNEVSVLQTVNLYNSSDSPDSERSQPTLNLTDSIESTTSLENRNAATPKDNIENEVTKAFDIKEQTQENVTHSEVIVNKNDSKDNSVPMSDNKQVDSTQSTTTSTQSYSDRVNAFTKSSAAETNTVSSLAEVTVSTAAVVDNPSVERNETNFTLEINKNEIPSQTENKLFVTQGISTSTAFNENIENSTFIETNETTVNSTKAGDESLFTGNITCSEKHFACLSKDKNYVCKETKHLCDSVVDCDDGFDEHNCTEACGQNFNCANSSYLQCIPRKFYCDGLWDCENGVDEDKCQIEKCSDPNKVICKDRSSCLIPYQICDGNYDCRDHSDELGCIDTTGCERDGRFMCDNNLCIDYSLRCDGFNDCTDGRDEQNCTCLANEFQCENGDCIEKEAKCNGKNDCRDGSDEWSCVRVDQNDVVHLMNPNDNRWSILCSNENFTKSDADTFCHNMGFESSTAFSTIAVEIGNETVWAIKDEDYYLYSPNCSANFAQTVVCKPFECSVKVDSEVKAGTSNEIQSLVLLKAENGTKECLAEIISPIWLLASSECLNFEKKWITVWMNHTSMIAEIEKVIRHPHSSKFRSLLIRDFDLAVIKLKEPINFHETHSNAVCLPENEVDFEITCFVNKIDETDPVPFTLLDVGICNEQFHYNSSLTKRQLCANNQRKTSDHRSEELAIGSPLMCLSSESKWFLAGLLSYSNRRKSFKKHPSIFSNIFAMKTFIKLVTGGQQYNVSYDDTLYRVLSETELILLRNLTEMEKMKTMNRLEFMSSPSFTETDINADNTTDIPKMVDFFPTELTTTTDVIETTAIDGVRLEANSTAITVTELSVPRTVFTATVMALNESSSRNV